MAIEAGEGARAPAALAERSSRLARISRPLRNRSPRFAALLASFPSRLFLLAAGYYLLLTCGSLWLHPQAQPQAAAGPLNLAQWGAAFTAAWRHWDSLFFLHIARSGYTDPGLAAFFPLYPALIRLAAWPLGGHFTLAALVVSWLCSWGACLWFYRLAAREDGDPFARQALLFLLCCPLIFFGFAPYSESLFLMVSIGAVERARAGRPWQAGFLGAAAVLTRSAGILLLIPLGWEWLRRSDRCRSLRDRLLLLVPHWRAARLIQARQQLPAYGQVETLERPPARWALLSLALIPLALMGYMLYLKAATGDPLAFLAGEYKWHRSLTPPWETAALVLTSLHYTWQHQFVGVYINTLIDLLLVLPLTALVLYSSIRRHLPWFGAALYQTGLALLLIAVPVHPGAAGWQEILLSTQRLLLPAFPTFLLLGRVGVSRPRLARLLLLASLAALTIYTLQFLNGDFIA
ncbi:MAG TPA: mannosyltransferase family protein [Ktedonobacterales bacterium]